MTDDSIDTVAMLIYTAFLLSAGGIVGVLASNRITNASWYSEAIEAGVAEYVVDKKTGETTFVWKEPKE